MQLMYRRKDLKVYLIKLIYSYAVSLREVLGKRWKATAEEVKVFEEKYSHINWDALPHYIQSAVKARLDSGLIK